MLVMLTRNARKYKRTLIRMMSFLDNEEYEQGATFTIVQLGALTADSVMRWFNFETYEVPEPPNEHDLNLLERSNTLKYWKKALSSFMPNRLAAWNELSGVGNPARSQDLNALIKAVQKKEVWGQGAPSRARRSISDAEYRRIVTILKEEGGDIIWKYGIPALKNYQFPFISRIDCAAQAKCQNIKPHEQFEFALKGKLDWSKNVLEEQI